ncbi:MAG: PEP-CTERM sorting domain-containing protein [Burkholderiaceae bacterium]|nr:PEP-CTERM sorting domain-containing protein [Burkholderiaceae bacterium]
MKNTVSVMMRALVIGAALLAGQAYAEIVLTPNEADYAWHDEGNCNAACVHDLTGDTVVELYKQNVGGSEEFGAADWYTTTFDPLNDPVSATIVWDGPGYIDCPICWLLVKDGNEDPNKYLFDLSEWDGMETIQLNDFWPGNGAISHVSIFGDVTNVPTPATLALLGLGALGLAFSRRRKQA